MKACMYFNIVLLTMDIHIHCLICGSAHSFNFKTVNCWSAVLFTLCRASTCKSWKSEVSSLMAWLARITDKTPNPWCLEKKKTCQVSLTEGSSCCNCMTSINAKPYSQKNFYFYVRHTLCQDQVSAILRHPWCVQQYPGHVGQQEDLSLSLCLQALWGSGSESGTGCSGDTRLRATGSSDNAEKSSIRKKKKKKLKILAHFSLKCVRFNQGTAHLCIYYSMKHLLPLQLCASYWWLVQSFHRSPAATNRNKCFCPHDNKLTQCRHCTGSTAHIHSDTVTGSVFFTTYTYFSCTINSAKILHTKLYLHISGQLWLRHFHSPPL